MNPTESNIFEPLLHQHVLPRSLKKCNTNEYGDVMSKSGRLSTAKKKLPDGYGKPAPAIFGANHSKI